MFPLETILLSLTLAFCFTEDLGSLDCGLPILQDLSPPFFQQSQPKKKVACFNVWYNAFYIFTIGVVYIFIFLFIDTEETHERQMKEKINIYENLGNKNR